MNKQIRQLGYFLMALFLLLFLQLNNVQVVQAAKLMNDPRNNRNVVRDFSSPRGSIITADGDVIAKSVATNDTYKELRVYPEGSLFGQITGFFSFNYGNDGLEQVYNKELTGHSYSLQHLTDLLTNPVHTDDVTITISKKLQQVAQQALGNRKGSVVALNPKTGEVLAMYSYPSYDPTPLAVHNFTAVEQSRNALLHNPDKPMLARAYRESFAPGSTFKLITSAAAFDHDPQLTTKQYPQLKALALPQSDKSLSNFGGEVCGGTLPDLLRISCNTGFGQMGMDLGAQNLYSEATAFGFNSRPPLDEPAVAASTFPQLSFFTHNKPGLAYSAIGQQNVSATPLQMALIAAGIANGGRIMKPYLLKEIRDNNGNVVRTANPEPWLQPTSPQTAEAMKNLMINVVKSGTATAAAIPNVQVAAKTGTAQTSGNNVNAWLVSFAPADNPQIAVAVIVENQTGDSEATGGRIAAPIAQTVMKAALGIS